MTPQDRLKVALAFTQREGGLAGKLKDWCDRVVEWVDAQPSPDVALDAFLVVAGRWRGQGLSRLLERCSEFANYALEGVSNPTEERHDSKGPKKAAARKSRPSRKAPRARSESS